MREKIVLKSRISQPEEDRELNLEDLQLTSADGGAQPTVLTLIGRPGDCQAAACGYDSAMARSRADS